MAAEDASADRILIAAVEGGGTSTTLLLMDASDSSQVHSATGGPTNPYLVSNDDAHDGIAFPGVIKTISELLSQAVQLLQQPTASGYKHVQVQAMVLAISGFGKRSDAALLENDLMETGLALRCVVTGDAEAPARCVQLLQSDGDKWNLADTVVLISGTGSAAFKYSSQVAKISGKACKTDTGLFSNIDERATISSWSARAGGRGHILGDHGSAYWIGREALSLALLAHDEGRHTLSTAWVAQQAVDFFNLKEFQDVVTIAQDSQKGKTNIAGFARVLAEGALQLRGEDKVDEDIRCFCSNIFQEAGSWLGRLLGSVIFRNAQGGDGKAGNILQSYYSVVLVGSVWKSWTFLESGIVETLRNMHEHYRNSGNTNQLDNHSNEIHLRFLKITRTAAIAGLYDAAGMITGQASATKSLCNLVRGAVDVIHVVTL